ncbi:unnamed protein product [Nyctereutes procyonoides]|uniref:Glutathione S-transferase n=1 Tax=Nyctereutes procyonoides TaxID=34880 RepID=A0A811ZLN0_NYCPR|nr:unnamed protein product [Nyctereutes procyonoides]
MAMILGYWDIRRLPHAAHLLLEYTDSHYEKYTMGDAPGYDRSQWLNEKFKLGLDFPNLPYLIDGAHKITRATPSFTEEEKIRVDVLENEVMDTKLKREYVKANPDKMKLYSQLLGKRPWFAGEKLTYVDFLVYHILDLPRISLKSISAYMKSSCLAPGLLFLMIAMWGNK